MDIPPNLALAQEVEGKRAKARSMVEGLVSAGQSVKTCVRRVDMLNAPPVYLDVSLISLDHLPPSEILSETLPKKVVLQKLLRVLNSHLLTVLEHTRTTGLPNIAPLVDRLCQVAATYSKQSTECTQLKSSVDTYMEEVIANLNKIMPAIMAKPIHSSLHWVESPTRQLLINDGMFASSSSGFGSLPLDTSVGVSSMDQSPTAAQGPSENLLPQISRYPWMINPNEGYKPWLDSGSYNTPVDKAGTTMSCMKEATATGQPRIKSSRSMIPIGRSLRPEGDVNRLLFPPQSNSTQLESEQECSPVPIEWSSILDSPLMCTPSCNQQTSWSDMDQVLGDLYSPMRSSPLKSYLDNVASVDEAVESNHNLLDYPSSLSSISPEPKCSVLSTTSRKKSRPSLDNLIQRYTVVKKRMDESNRKCLAVMDGL